MPLHQYDYLFAFGCIFAALDAFNIGANDVANSFATSVSSKSLTMRQAVLAASVMEFAGAVAVGARVADTIKNGIISPRVFQGQPSMQLLSFTVALSVSATWLMIATRMSWPVSTTYSIVSAVAGVGVAVGGRNAVTWGWNGGKGLGAIFAGLILAPALAAGFAAVCYLFVKFGVLHRKNPVRWAIFSGPLVFFTVSAVMTMSIVFKGAPSLGLNKMSEAKTAAAIVLSATVVMILSILFWVPYVYCKVVKQDYTIRWYHFFLGPALWSRPAPPPIDGPEGAFVPDYRIRKEENDTTETSAAPGDVERQNSDVDKEGSFEQPAGHANGPSNLAAIEKKDQHSIEGPWILPKNLYIIFRYKVPYVLSYGMNMDIHAEQAGKAGTAEHARMMAIYAAAKQYDNKTEHCYSFVQVLTACVASFAHGANDVSNAIGPFAVIYHVWSTGELSGSKAPVPVWILVAGAAFLVLGLATYGYNIMKVLGNKITLHSPSRGFTMELGAAITVILASQYGLPVSTTMCITGATMGVALCNGDYRAVNYRALGWIFAGWILTILVVGTGAGCVMGIIINAPRFGLVE